MADQKMKLAAVSLVENDSGRLLSVWNRRYGGWSLPGGLVEPEERPDDAQRRELLEETGCGTLASFLFYEGASCRPRAILGPDQTANEQAQVEIDQRRASWTMLYVVAIEGTPRENEPGGPVTWLSREEFLRWSPFSEFCRGVFALHPGPIRIHTPSSPIAVLPSTPAPSRRIGTAGSVGGDYLTVLARMSTVSKTLYLRHLSGHPHHGATRQ